MSLLPAPPPLPVVRGVRRVLERRLRRLVLVASAERARLHVARCVGDAPVRPRVRVHLPRPVSPRRRENHPLVGGEVVAELVDRYGLAVTLELLSAARRRGAQPPQEGGARQHAAGHGMEKKPTWHRRA
eukprot:7390969-Prymnesium_polylepis.1